MTALVLDLPPELYARLRAEAERQGKPPESVAREWLNERLTPPSADLPGNETQRPTGRERVRAALRAAGLLIEPTPEQLAWAETDEVTPPEVREALDRAGGKPLSEIILEQRGPRG